MNYILVALGGMLGSVGRYAVSSATLHSFPNVRFPVGTFLVNIIGCFLIGIAAGIAERLTAYNNEIRLFIITGFLGGFTTFSAFSIETLHLYREGDAVLAVVYALLSVVTGIVLVYAGLKCAV